MTEMEYIEKLRRYKIIIRDIPEEDRTEAICLEAVKQDGYAIEYITNPSDAVKLAAVRQNGLAIQYITNPSEEVQIEAVSKTGYAIQYIKNPSEKVQLEALSKKVFALKYIKNPSEKVQLEAVSKNGFAIEYIKNPSEKVQLEAVKQNGVVIKLIKNPSEKVQIEAVRQNGFAIEYIKNPSEAVCLEAVKQNGNAIEYIKNPSEAVCLEAVKQNGDAIRYIINPRVRENGEAIQYITNPSEKVQLEAVKQNGHAIQYITNPSEAVRLEAVKQNGDAIRYIPYERTTLQIVKAVLSHESPNITDKDVIEYCQIKEPYALLNSGKEEYLFEVIEKKIGNNPEEKEILDKLRNITQYDKKYLEWHGIGFFWKNLEEDEYGDSCIVTYDAQINSREMFLDPEKERINRAMEFEEKLGYVPEFDVSFDWENSIEEYNKEEHQKLLKAGVIKKSSNYREEEHKIWIVKMYQIFGYEESLKMLETIPDLTEEMAEELIIENEAIYNEVFEKKYTLTGEIGLTVELINRINSVAGKDAFKIFKEINVLLEQGDEKSLKEVLLKYNLSEKEIERVLKNVSAELNREKIEKIEDSLHLAVNQNVTHQQGRIHDLILKAIKSKLEKEEEITEENLEKAVLDELNSKEETGEYRYSLVIRREEENIKQVVKNFINQNGIEKILNNNIIKILKRSKEKIGEGWIRKIIEGLKEIAQEMTKEEYEKVCEVLGIQKIEHEEEIKLKGEDEETKKKARELLLSLGCQELITFEKMETMFGGLHSPYSKVFGEYFIRYKEEFMSDPEYIGNFAKMHNKFETIIKNPNLRQAYEQGRLKVKTVLAETLKSYNFAYRKGEAELAKRAREGQLEDEYWPDAQRVFEETRKREETTIPPTKVVGKKFRGRMLRVDDPLQLFVGDITGCCQRFGDVGEASMLHGSTEKNGGIFVIEEIDEKGNVVKLVAQSWTWRNDDVMCFDNIEVKGDSLTHEEQAEVLQIYQDAANRAIQIDKKALKEMLKQGKITQEQYEYYTLKEVRIGLGYNQGMRLIDEKIANGELEKSYDVVKPKEAGKRYQLGRMQRDPWLDSELSVVIARNDEMRRKPKPANVKGEVPVTYTKPREVREEEGYNIDEDMIDMLKQIEAGTYRKGQQIIQECENVADIAYAYDCEPEKLKVTVSRDKDWFAMYYEEEDSIYIADIALVNGTHAEKNSERKTETIISSLELAKKMYELFIEAAEKEKTVTCDATKDTSGLNIQNMIKNGLVEVIKSVDYDWDEEIQMSKMTLVPDKEKIEKELKKLEKLIEKAEERRKVYKKKTEGLGEDGR